MTRKWTASRNAPAVAGLVVIVGGVGGVAAYVDRMACNTGRPTISRWLGRNCLHPTYGPFMVAIAAAPIVAWGWHLGQIIVDEAHQRLTFST